MQSRIRLVLSIAALIGMMAVPSAAALRVVATTEDLASLTREVGGDKVTVVALARGYQDPHFVDPKPSFILEVSRADLLIIVGRDLEIGWLPPLITSSRNAKIQQGAPAISTPRST
jgi:zinc/manganese transport system substrate-binding protein